MKEPSDTTVLVWDNGIGLPIAERLARDVKRCLYFSPWQKDRLVSNAVIGDGIPGIERVPDAWLVKNEVDVWVFPDCTYAGEQIELASQGRAVWGSRRAINLENDREKFLKVLADVGLEVPEHNIVVGVTALRDFLSTQEDCYIKISNYRGSFETCHWRSWELDENLIDFWAVNFGAVREMVRFVVLPSIHTDLEIGGDTYNVGGEWPSLMLHGIESKDTAYFSAVTECSAMPEQVIAVNEAFAPILKSHGYANEWSVEIRVKDDHFYFIDPTCRLGLPSTGSQLELWENFSEIVCAGAHGELVDPIPTAMFSAELALTVKHKGRLWPTVKIPPELQQWVKLADSCEMDGVRSFPKDSEDNAEEVGWLVAIGDTPKDTLDTLKKYVDLLPKGLSADIAPLAGVLEEIETMEKKKIEFAQEPMPDPSEVLS